MKQIINLFFAFFLILAVASCNCGGEKETTDDVDHEGVQQPTSSTGNFGEEITTEEAIEALELPEMFGGNETVEVKLIGNVESVCQMSGCWMDVEISEEETVHVTFKDDGFVVPKDAAGKIAIIEGIATYEEIPVDILKHLAKDEGKSQEEIDAITEPAMEYTLVAKGVILQ